MNLILNLFIGVITGLISGIMMYLYADKINKIRKIIEYAEKTADYTFEISEEAEECIKGKSIDGLKQLLRKSIHRPFGGDIIDGTEESQKLQNAIANCNGEISKIYNAVNKKTVDKEEVSYNLFLAQDGLPGALSNLWNATVDYEVAKEKTKKRWFKMYKKIKSELLSKIKKIIMEVIKVNFWKVVIRVLFAIIFMLCFFVIFNAFISMKTSSLGAWYNIAASLAVITALLSAWSASKIVESQENSLNPYPYLLFDVSSRYMLIQLVLRNFGGSPAYNIRIEWDKPLISSAGQQIKFNDKTERDFIPFLLHGESISVLVRSKPTSYAGEN